MDLFLYYFPWMIYNLYLAFLPVIFGLFLFRMPNKFYSFLLGIIWFLYLPNTIYVYTDLQHLIEQWSNVTVFIQVLLVIQYAIFVTLGLACYLVAFYPFEKMLRGAPWRETFRPYIIILVNFVIGFALVVGKFHRVNSWDVLIAPQTAMNGIIAVLQSDDYMGLVILFGIFANCFYFLFRDRVIAFMSKRLDHTLLATPQSLSEKK